MTKVKFEKQFYDICNKHGIVVFFNDPSVTEKDNGYAKWNEVHLGNRYTNNHIYAAVAFHEFGHAVINIKRFNNVKKYTVNSTFNEEFSAWYWAMRYYQQYFNKPFNRQQGLFMLKCLKTHADNDYAFKDVFKDYQQNASTLIFIPDPDNKK